MLGAEEFGFGTAAVVAIGCDMARACHLNTCPTGIATQDPKYRAKFDGTAEMAVHYFTHVAMEVREILASLGFRKLDEVVGRPDLLEARVDPGGQPGRAPRSVADPDAGRSAAAPARACTSSTATSVLRTLRSIPRSCATPRRRSRAASASRLRYTIQNAHRTVGARLAGEIARRYGSNGLPERYHRDALQGQRRPELRGLGHERHAPDPGGRGERLRRQGPLRRRDRHHAAGRGRLRAARRT